MSNLANSIVLGDKPRITINVAPIGGIYNLSELDWTVEFYATQGSVTMSKKDATPISEDEYSMRVDTSTLGTGKLLGILYPQVPDRQSPDGYYVPPVPFDTGQVIISPYSLGYDEL